MNKKRENRIRRHKRVRAKVHGTLDHPRLSVFRSNRFVYAQLIDDGAQRTILGVHSAVLVKNTKKTKDVTKQDVAREVGCELARRAKEKNIIKIIFDRGGYRYQGRVRAVAEGAREGGLEF
jgi:large subunit ribosomal protein L18